VNLARVCRNTSPQRVKLPRVNFPKILNARRLRDHSVEPPIESIAYPVFVQSTDDGNAFGGIRHPMVDAPLATHAGRSLRASGYGEGDLFTIQGSMTRSLPPKPKGSAPAIRAVARSALCIARGLGCATGCGDGSPRRRATTTTR
jgi:hypothetical protein